MRAEGVTEAAVGEAQLIFGDDEKRCAEAVRKILHIATIDPEIAIRADADELSELGAVVARLVQGRGAVKLCHVFRLLFVSRSLRSPERGGTIRNQPQSVRPVT